MKTWEWPGDKANLGLLNANLICTNDHPGLGNFQCSSRNFNYNSLKFQFYDTRSSNNNIEHIHSTLRVLHYSALYYWCHLNVPYAGCGSDTTQFPPLDLNFYWPPTLKGHRIQLPCHTSSPDDDDHMINVTRMCSEDGQWLEPIGLQDCYDDNVNVCFDEISELLNQVSLSKHNIQISNQKVLSSNPGCFLG